MCNYAHYLTLPRWRWSITMSASLSKCSSFSGYNSKPGISFWAAKCSISVLDDRGLDQAAGQQSVGSGASGVWFRLTLRLCGWSGLRCWAQKMPKELFTPKSEKNVLKINVGRKRFSQKHSYVVEL